MPNMMNRNQLLKEVCALMKELELPKSEVVRMSNLNKYELNDMREELTILKYARNVDCADVDKIQDDKDSAEYNVDYAMIKQYYKRNRDTALVSK